jgi:hypothetical protein
MIAELEATQISADRAKQGYESQERAVSKVVTKYIPAGMRKEDAFKRIQDLKDEGFEIGEYRCEGVRVWPDGDLKPYLDEATRKNLQNRIAPGYKEKAMMFLNLILRTCND